MTSNTAPSGEVMTSSVCEADGYAGCLGYKAFDAITNDGITDDKNYWHSAKFSGDEWIQYKFTSPVKVNKVKLNLSSNRQPVKYEIRASNDGGTWDTLGSYSRTEDKVPHVILHIINNYKYYRYYRLHITEANNFDLNKFVVILQLQFYGREK